MNLKRLPLEGGLLKELRIFGNGKRCSVRMETTEPEGKVRFSMMDPVIEIDLQGRARATVFNDGSDVELGVRILPVEPLRVENLVVDYGETRTPNGGKCSGTTAKDSPAPSTLVPNPSG